MPLIHANGLDQYYREAGDGPPLIFVHGAFVDLHMWDAQVDFFADSFRVIRYDLRGHGKTGRTDLKPYAIEIFADDLAALLDELAIDHPIVCGLSLGGMIAQAFAVKYSQRPCALVLSDTAVSVRLTLMDKLQRYVLFPKWLMRLTIRLMDVDRFVRFSFWLAKATRSDKWFGQDEETREYIRQCMLDMVTEEYLKIYGAIYDFDLLNLESIRVPTLVLNGEYESRSVFRHTQEILKRVENSEAHIIPGAGHTSNMENAREFNRHVAAFLQRL